MKKNVTFLTKKDFNVKSLIKNLKDNYDSITNTKDQQILKEIIDLLMKNGTSFLSPQEVHFLDSNSDRNWAEYLIFRYKMKYFPGKQIVYDFPIFVMNWFRSIRSLVTMPCILYKWKNSSSEILHYVRDRTTYNTIVGDVCKDAFVDSPDLLEEECISEKMRNSFHSFCEEYL